MATLTRGVGGSAPVRLRPTPDTLGRRTMYKSTSTETKARRKARWLTWLFGRRRLGKPVRPRVVVDTPPVVPGPVGRVADLRRRNMVRLRQERKP